MSNYIKNEIRTIDSDIDYVLLRPGIYYGSMSPTDNTGYIYNKDTLKMEATTVSYTEGLIKAVSEIIDNSCDEALRTRFEICNKIDVVIKDNVVIVKDNGRGVPVEDDAYVGAFTSLKTGSNFGDQNGEDRETLGANGVGSAICNILSTSFKATSVTQDGKRGILICKNNMRDISHKVDDAPKSVTHGTTVEFIPDYVRYSVSHMDDIHIGVIYTRLINLAMTFPNITFTFNGRMIKVDTFRDYMKHYSTAFEVLYETETMSIGVFPSEEYKFVHFANGLNISDGGNIMDYVSNNIVTKFTERLKKGFSKITNPAVKQKLGVVLVLRGMKNLSFSNQMKTKLTNTFTQLGLPTLDYTSFAEKMFKNVNIKEPIIELYRIQQEMEKRAALKNVKGKTKERVEKFIPATKEMKNLILSEGLSAQALLMNLNSGITRTDCSFYSLLGKPLSVENGSNQQIANNKVIQALVSILDMNLSNKSIDAFTHENVVICTDSDDGGQIISSLLITFFNKFSPELIKQGRLKTLRLPLMIAFDTKGSVVEHFIDFKEYSLWAEGKNLSKYNIKYYKGLSGFMSNTVEELFNKYGVDKFLDTLEYTDDTEETIYNWMSNKTVDFRKQKLTASDAILDIGLT
jgi:DNA gyrase/topoisomerase IV subunit B